MRQIKGKRKGLNIFNYLNGDRMETAHRLYNTRIIECLESPEGYSILLNTGGFNTKHTKNCMNDFLAKWDLKVIQRNFKWYVVGGDKYSVFSKEHKGFEFTNNESIHLKLIYGEEWGKFKVMNMDGAFKFWSQVK